MFVRLAVLFLFVVAMSLGACWFYFRFWRAERRRRHLRDIEDENERLDKIIHPPH